MDILFNSLLIIHITGGSIGLLAGSWNMVTQKGTHLHKRIGRVFFYALLTASLAALPMSFLHQNYFLLIVAVFTGYLLITGKRYLDKKKPADVANTDWLLCGVMFLFGTGFIIWGIYLLVNGYGFGTVLLVFGSISILMVMQDYKNFKGRSSKKNYWLTNHIQRMTGAFIASITAFIVVNNTVLPGVVAWLLPTVALVPVLVRWSKKYAVKVKE